MSPFVKSNWKTHCLGRHLVDAPPDAKVRATFKYGMRAIELVDPAFHPDTFRKIVAAREADLKSQKHNTRDTIFVRRVEHPNGSVTLVSWRSPVSERGYTLDCYLVARGRPDHVFRCSSGADADKLQTEIDFLGNLGTTARTLGMGEIPKEIGFCVERGLIQRAKPNDESFSAAIWLAGKPDVQLSISAFVQGKVEPGLLERAGGFLPGLLQSVGGIQTLRKRKRPVGPIYGEEILTAGSAEGKRLYAFKWEAPGKANSLAEPNLNVSLGVIESQYETNAESFASDQEALDLWDAVVESIRLRPGAV